MDLFERKPIGAQGRPGRLSAGKWTDHALKVQALLSDGSTLGLELTLMKADYENEPAPASASRQ